MASERVRVIFAGGGTGGHLYPALALAERIQMNWERPLIEFIGSHRGIEVKEVPRHGYHLHKLNIGGLVGKDPWALFKNSLRMLWAVVKARSILRATRPDVVFGVGGYASVPAMIAARLAGIPTLLLEQNSVPGLANRLLSRLATRCYASFESSMSYFPASRTRHVGNPVRTEILEESGVEPDPSRFTLFLFGGSQGSRALNNLILEALPKLMAEIPEIHVVHQTGQGEYFRVRDDYRREGLEDRVELHSFIEDMGFYYRRADICLCRSGATSVAELVSVRKPAILVPLDSSSGDHQRLNARSLSDKGAALLVEEADLTPVRLVALLKDLRDHSEKLRAMKKRLEAMPHPDAAKAILSDLGELLGSDKWRKKVV